MSSDPTSIEADLRRLRAAGLDASLLDRLDACADGTWAELDPVEIHYEKRLLSVTPAKLPPALMASLEATLRDTPFSNNQIIVPFPQGKAAAPHKHRGWWGAAAAVALTGAVTALLVPMNQDTGKTAEAPPNRSHAPTSITGGELVPAGFNRGLSEASDQGVIWQSNKQPHRVLRVVYKDRVTLKDAAGRTYQVEQPRVEYILVPAKTD